jgi:hypothetical protein
MTTGRRADLSVPFVLLGVGLGLAVAVTTLRAPALFRIERPLALAYGGLLVGFTLLYSYRPLRESRSGTVISATLLFAFAAIAFVHGRRGLVLPFGLFVVSLAGLGYELYKFTSDRRRRGQAS